MAKYRRKPIIVEAEIYKKGMEDDYQIGPDNEKIPYIISKGWVPKITIDKGDYIVTKSNGERYPCRPDIFHATYEKVEDA